MIYKVGKIWDETLSIFIVTILSFGTLAALYTNTASRVRGGRVRERDAARQIDYVVATR